MPATENNTCRRPEAILAIRFSALGDVALTIPTIYDICRVNPSQRVVMLTKTATAPLFINRPDNLIVEGVDFKREYKGLTGLWRLFARLTATYRITAVADLHDVLRTKVLRTLARLKGARVAVIDKGRAEKRRLLGKSTANPAVLASPPMRYADVFAALGLKGRGVFTTIVDGTRPADISAVTRDKQSGEHWIGIAPFAAHPSKIYPADLMEQTVAMLASIEGVRLFFFGAGDNERRIIEQWTAAHPAATSLARRLGFATEFEMIRRMDAMLTMDSANLHLATLAGVRVVSLWGSTHPAFGFGAWHADPALQMGVAMECRPCSVFGNRPCPRGDMRCMRAIAPAEVARRLASAAGIDTDNLHF